MLCDVIASDAHDDKHRKPILSDARDAVSNSFGADFAQALFLENPAAIIAGLPLPSSREISRETFYEFLGKIAAAQFVLIGWPEGRGFGWFWKTSGPTRHFARPHALQHEFLPRPGNGRSPVPRCAHAGTQVRLTKCHVDFSVPRK
jgi:hypothetical protein